MAVICCLFPSTRKTRCLVRCGSRGVRLAAGGRGGDVLRLADGGGEVGDGDDLGHLLDPGTRAVPLAGVPAVLRAHGDALAVALHHDHVAVRLLFFFRVAGAPGVEVARPGGEVFREAGELGAAGGDAGAGLDDLLGLPEPAAGQVEGRQGPHPQGVRVLGQDLPGISGVQVRLAAVAVGLPGDPDRPEHAGHAPAVTLFHGAVPDPGGARDSLGPLLAGAVDVERGLQQPPLQLPPLLADHLLPLPVAEVPGLVRRPGRQPGELLRRGGQSRRQLPVQRGLAPVLPDLPDCHREPHRHRRASRCLPGMIPAHHPGNGPGPCGTSDGTPSRPRPGRIAATSLTRINRHQQCQKRPGTSGLSQYNPVQP